MKKIFPVVVLTLMANLAFAETFTAPMVPRKAPPSQKPPPLPPRQTGGVIPRAVRGGNPLQMLNPLGSPAFGRPGGRVVLRDLSEAGDAAHLPADHIAPPGVPGSDRAKTGKR